MFSQAELSKYAEIFQAQGQVNGFLAGATARTMFLNSGLPVNKLEKIWDLSDMDNDGQLDFDEFCVAMHLTYDSLNGGNPPASLPPQLIPNKKRHLVGNSITPQMTGYQQPQQTGYQAGYQQPQPTGFQNPQQTGYQQPQPTGYQQQQYTGVPSQYTGFSAAQQKEFDWGITPQDLNTYGNIYNKYANASGKVRFSQMEDFYSTLPVTRQDLSSAWSLVDVNHAQALTRDQCLVYFHVLNERSRGASIPSELPQDLKSAFAGEYAADLGDRPGSGTGARKGNGTSMSKSAQLADSYVNRLGVASTTLSSKGSTVRGGKYDEEDLLKRELAELQEKVRDAEENAKRSSDSGVAFSARPLKEQFQALYDYKLRQLTEKSDLEEKTRKQERDIETARDAVRRLSRIVDEVRDRKRELETLLEERRYELQKTQRLIDTERL
ncbi:cytoskeletal-regulatory complex EF hand-domain-containing protein [Umbelopsis sp. AD052]|nr:cytoskeletal-regulatory complex EF hand-domain-containing protein [Umbelopsis sp. AD052]